MLGLSGSVSSSSATSCPWPYRRRPTTISGRWALGAGRWALGAGRWALGAGRWALGAGRWALGAGRWALGEMLGMTEPEEIEECRARASVQELTIRGERQSHGSRQFPQ